MSALLPEFRRNEISRLSSRSTPLPSIEFWHRVYHQHPSHRGAIACGRRVGTERGFAWVWKARGIDTGIYRRGARPLASRFWSGSGKNIPSIPPTGAFAHSRADSNLELCFSLELIYFFNIISNCGSYSRYLSMHNEKILVGSENNHDKSLAVGF